jgi:ABC-type phosphate/phosphonate transport system substrate-binding protein
MDETILSDDPITESILTEISESNDEMLDLTDTKSLDQVVFQRTMLIPLFQTITLQMDLAKQLEQQYHTDRQRLLESAKNKRLDVVWAKRRAQEEAAARQRAEEAAAVAAEGAHCGCGDDAH